MYEIADMFSWQIACEAAGEVQLIFYHSLHIGEPCNHCLLEVQHNRLLAGKEVAKVSTEG